jgi:hypothetical protein
VGEYRVFIGTTKRTREFPYEELDDARWAANMLWLWAKQHDEHGTVTIYEQTGGRWVMINTAKV